MRANTLRNVALSSPRDVLVAFVRGELQDAQRTWTDVQGSQIGFKELQSAMRVHAMYEPAV